MKIEFIKAAKNNDIEKPLDLLKNDVNINEKDEILKMGDFLLENLRKENDWKTP